jgi:hypothetical protein
MMNTKTFQEQAYERLIVSSQQTLPVAPYPRKHVHCAFDKLEDAVHALQALRAVGYNAGDISLMASWDYVEAVEREPQQPRRFLETLLDFFSFLDDSFDVYLREARRGRHILAVRVSRHEQIMQVRDVLVPHHAHLMKYIDTWTVADLSS